MEKIKGLLRLSGLAIFPLGISMLMAPAVGFLFIIVTPISLLVMEYYYFKSYGNDGFSKGFLDNIFISVIIYLSVAILLILNSTMLNRSNGISRQFDLSIHLKSYFLLLGVLILCWFVVYAIFSQSQKFRGGK